MNARKLIWASIFTGAAVGILLAPEKRKNVLNKMFSNRSNFNGELDKKLKRLDSSVRKQVKRAKKEIRDLVEHQQKKIQA